MTRILTALILIPLVVWGVLWAPSWALALMAALVGVAAYREFDDIAAAQGIARTGWIGIAAGLAVLWMRLPDLHMAIIIAMVLMIAKLSAKDLRDALPSVGVGLLGVLYIFGAWRYALVMRDDNPHFLMIALLVSWVGDTAAMYVGKAFGRHKLAPRISPGKTWEGSVGSALGGTLAAVVYAHYFIPQAPPAWWVFIGLLGNIAGQVGDLCESALKRGAGVKDSGTTLPGHGGWLDRIDSSLFSIPAVYAAIRFIGPDL